MAMGLESIVSPLTPLVKGPASVGLEEKNVETVEFGQSVFGAIFQNAINNVRETDAVKNEAVYLLSTGQLDNPSAAVIAMTQNELSVNLLVQLRQRALDAYSELTRISL